MEKNIQARIKKINGFNKKEVLVEEEEALEEDLIEDDII